MYGFFIQPLIFRTVMKFVFLFAPSLLLLFSCRDLVQDEFPYFPQTPVINSILAKDSILKLHISYTDKIDSRLLRVADDADVSFFINDSFAEKLEYFGNGLYCSHSIIAGGNKYSCGINIPTYSPIAVSDSIVPAVEIIHIKHIENAGKTEEGEAYPAVEFTFSNNPNQKLYFEVLIKLMVYGAERYANIIDIDDPLLLNEGIPIAVFSNELIEQESYTMRLNYSTGHSNGNQMELFPLVLEIRTSNYDYYQFVKQLYLYNLGRYPDGFSSSSSVFSVYSNIESAYGIFAGYASSCSDTIVP